MVETLTPRDRDTHDPVSLGGFHDGFTNTQDESTPETVDQRPLTRPKSTENHVTLRAFLPAVDELLT